MRFLKRATFWLYRFASAAAAIGFFNACKVFFGRLTNSHVHITLPRGLYFKFRGRTDHGVVTHFFTLGYYIQDSADHPIRKIVDCGANIGDETARFAIQYPEAQIVAIEPESANYELLSENFRSLNRIKALKGAVWPRRTHLELVPDPGGSAQGFSVLETSGGAGTVQTWTIPDIMQLGQWDAIDILKLDIEGAEFELFTQAYQDWIDRINVIIFEVPDHDRPGTTQAIFRAISGKSFNSHVCGENLILIRSDLPWRLQRVVGFSHL